MGLVFANRNDSGIQAGSFAAHGSRIWLDSPTLARVTAKKVAGDADWLKFKADADFYMAQATAAYTISNISNTKPAVATIVETVPWATEEDVYIAGLTGGWASVNALGYPPNFSYKTGTHTFELYNQAINIHYASAATTVEFTLWDVVPWASGTQQIRLTGFQNGWESMNGVWTATKTGTSTFTIPASSIGLPDDHSDYYAYVTYGGTLLMPVDATSFGSFAGQAPVMFPYNSVGYAYQGGGWFDLAFALSIAYKVLGNSPTAYGTKAVAWLDYWVSLGKAGMRQPVSADSYFATRFTMSAMALIYDWCYPLLTSTQKTDFATCINNYYDLAVASALEINGPLASNYFTGHLFGLGLPGIASYGDNARAGEILAAIHSRIDTVCTPGFAVGAPYEGGYPFEAFGYGTNAYERLLYYYDALKVATGEDLQSGLTQLIRNTMHNLRPDRWRANDEGDYPGSFTGVLNPSYPVVLAHALSGTAGQWAKYLYDHLASNAGQVTPYMTRLLWYDSTATATNYTATEAVSYYSPGDGKLIRRTDWTDAATWACVNGGSLQIGGHQARVAGHVSLQRGVDVLMPYAGQWKGADGESGSPPSMFTLTGGVANTLFHYDGHVHNFYSPPDSDQTYYGNQGYWGTTQVESAKADALDQWAYLQADLTSAYDTNAGTGGRTLTAFRRSAVLAGNIQIIFDYIVRGSTAYHDDVRWHFNWNGTVSVAANLVTVAAIGASKVFLKAFAPGSTAPSAPTIAADTLKESFITDAGAVAAQRIIVSDAGTPATTNRFLTAIHATASGTVSMPATALITETGNTRYGLSFVDGSTTWVVMFSADGTIQDSGSFTI